MFAGAAMTEPGAAHFVAALPRDESRQVRSSQSVYIADVCTILPKRVDAAEFADIVFSKDRVGARINRIAAKFVDAAGIATRPSVIDLDRFPKIALGDRSDEPLCWGERIVERLRSSICLDDVGFLGVVYNNSSHRDHVPSLAAQIALKTGLRLDEPPHQHTHLGCAAPLFSLEIATDYCRRRDRAAIVFCFDQNTWHVITDFHPDDPKLKQKMRANLLFSDGAVGLLLIPESMRRNYTRPLPRILDNVTSFHAGDLMRTHNGDFLVERDVPKVMPPLVMEKLVRPAMARLEIATEDVTEWSIHQGGSAVLDELCKEAHLGLTDEQAIRSRDLFHRYGNLSGPSCLFVLDDYFHESAVRPKAPELGLVVGFGAGYYFGLTAYQWDV